MTKAASPPRPRGTRAPGSAREARGGAPATAPVRTFPPAASPIRVSRGVEGCIHCCGKCETHPCRLKGQV